ncbi:inner membrane protein [Halomicrobium zhouii]|uniref:Inner membrane protein n=1 Tax=Halomicrobium zhouii TaxID=767519 RepID=A0A1I6L6Y7_9EURY|nr:metal-dependent hydrolase [Halomicrobium zhouii]SFR98998.1 inner membrane protein [Halomicrobium zhouii]
MPVDLPVGDHAAFLWMAVATHALVGYTLGKVLVDEPAWGLLGGVAADLDLLFPLAWQPPLVHRGVTHTVLAAALLTLLVARWRRSAGLAVGTAYASQLAIDATTPAGIPLLYPITTARVGVELGGHSRSATVLLWAGCLAALYRWQ